MSAFQTFRRIIRRLIYPTRSWAVAKEAYEGLDELRTLPARSGKTFQMYSHAGFSSLSPVSDALAAAHAEIKQLKFLLASAPMIEVPSSDARAWARRAGAPFAYINPKTMAQITFEPVKGHFMVFPGSKTKWVLTSLMPERRVIFSPLAIPGIEKILAA